MLRRSGWGLLVLAALASGGCSPWVGQASPKEQAAMAPPVWPEPPAPARMRFVSAVSSPGELGIRPSLWERLGTLLAGESTDRMVRPTGIAVRGETMYVADPGAQVLWVLDRGARRFAALRGARGERLVSPVAVAVGARGRIYVADSQRRQVVILRDDGTTERSLPGPPFLRPAGLAYDPSGDRLYVADSAAHRLWLLSGDGLPLGEIGGRGTGAGQFNYPTHVAVGREGTLYVTDALGFRIQRFSRDGRFLGAFGRQGDTSGSFAAPKGVAVDSEGHVYVVDALFDAVQVFDAEGQLLLGIGRRGSGPGQFWLPGGLCIDGQDRVYIADSHNRRIQILQYLPEPPA